MCDQDCGRALDVVAKSMVSLLIFLRDCGWRISEQDLGLFSFCSCAFLLISCLNSFILSSAVMWWYSTRGDLGSADEGTGSLTTSGAGQSIISGGGCETGDCAVLLFFSSAETSSLSFFLPDKKARKKIVSFQGIIHHIYIVHNPSSQRRYYSPLVRHTEWETCGTMTHSVIGFIGFMFRKLM